MSKRQRSPVSEGTLFQNVVESGINVFSDEDSNTDNSLNDSSSSDFVDDSDADPTYNPDLPSTSAGPGKCTVPNPIVTPRPDVGNFSTSDDSEDESIYRTPNPSLTNLTSTPLRRGSCIDEFSSSEEDINNVNTQREICHRPIRRRQPRRRLPAIDIGEARARQDDPESSWDEIIENEDSGFQHSFQYAELPGPKHCPPQDSKPITYLNLFLTSTLISTFVLETNRYATNYLAAHVNRLSPHSRLKDWTNVTVAEMKAFLAIVLNMGLICKPTIESYWSQKSSQSTTWFRKLMSRNRFEIILKFFHITDVSNIPQHGQPDYNPLGRFQPLIDHANRLFRQFYTPNQSMSIDESLVGTKKRIGLTQYMPKKKHHRWGIKLWVLCDAITHYCVAFSCYKGARNMEDIEQRAECGLAHKVVVNLMEMGNYLNKGFHLYLDNFFTSIPLARYLYSKLTWLTGTLRLNRKGVPKQLKGKYRVGQKVYVRKGPILQMAWREKKSNKSQFIILSTNSEATSVRYTIRRNRNIIIKTKPKIVHQYNRGMGGIDGTDQMLYTYLDERKNLKPWKKVIFNVLGRMVLNAYVLYKINTQKPMCRYDFMVDIVEELAADKITGRADAGTGGDGPGGKFGLEKLPDTKQKDCSVCSGKNNPEGKRKRSRLQCTNCKVGVHPECLVKHNCV